jgi:hypothetical protein
MQRQREEIDSANDATRAMPLEEDGSHHFGLNIRVQLWRKEAQKEESSSRSSFVSNPKHLQIREIIHVPEEAPRTHALYC